MHLEELSIEHETVFLQMVSTFGQVWTSAQFLNYVKDCAKQRQDWRPKAGKISQTHYLLREGQGPLLAKGVMRFPLDPVTEIDGGNLWCEVPPPLRGQGYGSYCLALMLFEAVRAGLRRALVTAPAADLAARRMIEKNRGQLLDEVFSTVPEREKILIARYWINFS